MCDDGIKGNILERLVCLMLIVKLHSSVTAVQLSSEIVPLNAYIPPVASKRMSTLQSSLIY